MTSLSSLASPHSAPAGGSEKRSSGPLNDGIAAALVRWVLTSLVACWLVFLFLTWLPIYLTWPWQNDTEHFAMLAQGWDAGKLPYRDMFSTQFPGEIYILYLLGKVFGWGNTVAYYAFDAALVAVFLVILVLWARRKAETSLPGLIGGTTFLLYYVSQNTLVAGEREWHAGFLMTCSLLLLGLDPRRRIQAASAIAFGLAVLIRPQVILILPAIVLAIHAVSQGRGGDWKLWAGTFVGWSLVAGVVAAMGFLPLVWLGVLGDFRSCAKVLLQPPYNNSSPLQILARMAPQKHPGVLLAVIPLIMLFWEKTTRSGRADARVVLAALLGVLFYSAISPVRNAYHAIPQVAVAAIGVTYLAIQILRFDVQPTRLTVAALGLTFLFFGASARPLSLMALKPGQETYSLATATRLLRTREMAPAAPLGYFSDYPWSDHRALMQYLRRNTTPDTRVANLLIEHTSAVTSEIPRLTQLPVDSNCLWNYHIASLVARDTAALENSAGPCVVLWDQNSPTLRSPEFAKLVATIRRLFAFEARFGTMEVWRRSALSASASCSRPAHRIAGMIVADQLSFRSQAIRMDRTSVSRQKNSTSPPPLHSSIASTARGSEGLHQRGTGHPPEYPLALPLSGRRQAIRLPFRLEPHPADSARRSTTATNLAATASTTD